METPTTQDLREAARNLVQFHESIPTLQTIGVNAAAVGLWLRFIDNLQPLSRFGMEPDLIVGIFSEAEERQVRASLYQLELPRLITELIQNRLTAVRNEITDWLKSEERYVTVDKGMSMSFKINKFDLTYCHWLPNGKIDRLKTALNMISDTARLPLVDKFAIMCKYCLEDEIEKFPRDSIPRHFIELHSGLSGNKLVRYWLHRLDKGSHELPSGFDPLSMIKSPGVVTWSAMEYFWDRLNDDERASQFEEILKRKPVFQKNLFSKISPRKVLQLIAGKPVRIMKNFWIYCTDEECFVAQIWRSLKNFVNDALFKDMIDMLTTDKWMNPEGKAKCLLDIWAHCTDHFKKLAFLPFITWTYKNLYMYNYCEFQFCGVEFLLPYLSYASPEYRKEFVIKNRDQLVVNLDPPGMHQLINFCLPDPSEALQFKKDILESKFIKSLLMATFRYINFDKVTKFLEYYCPDSNSRNKVCDEMLDTWHAELMSDIKADWIKAIEFLDKNLLPDCALKYKKKVVTTPTFASIFCQFLANDDETAKMMAIVEQVLDAEELKSFKREASKLLHKAYHQWYGEFDGNFVDVFISWCFDNDEQKAREFRGTLSINYIFDQIWEGVEWHRFLEGGVEEGTLYRVFEPLDKCLNWYFVDNFEDVKKFKHEKQLKFSDSKIPGWFWKRVSETEDALMRGELRKFFEGDR